MIQQPALGEKIVASRKAKGFTQEELVAKCNLNVRTLQRIEAGEVTPRISTVKLIFEALDIDFEQGISTVDNDNRTDKTKENRFGAMFNYKTNSMKKLLIIFIPLLSVLLMFFVMATRQKTFDVSDVKRTDISETGDLFINFYNSGQIDSIGTLFTENASFYPANSEVLYGRSDIVKFYKKVYESGFRMNFSKTTFITISDSIAVEKGVWEGTNNGIFTGNFLTQWRRVDGNWFIENTMNQTEE